MVFDLGYLGRAWSWCGGGGRRISKAKIQEETKQTSLKNHDVMTSVLLLKITRMYV